MIKQLLLLSTLFITSAFANPAYNANTVNSIQSIYWLSKTQDGAIIYANHHGFRQLKSFVDTTILTSEQATDKQFNLKDAEHLLLMQPAAKKWLSVYLSQDQLFYEGDIYLVEPSAIKEMMQMNNYRIEKGDAISAQVLNRAKASFGLSKPKS